MRSRFVGSVPLNIGEVISDDDGKLVRTILGSCVAVCMYHAPTRAASICHAVYAGKGKGAGTDTRYVIDAVHCMHRYFAKKHLQPSRVDVKIFGGASAIAGNLKPSLLFENRSVENALHELKKLGYDPVVADTGGDQSRELFFEFSTGHVYVRRISHKSPAQPGEPIRRRN